MNLIDFFNKLNTKCYPHTNINRWYYKIGRYLVKKLSDPILTLILRLPITYTSSTHKVNIIVSLTSFPARIHNVWKTIATLKRQSISPTEIVLCLTEEEFPNGMDDIPYSLKKQIDNIFKIVFVKNNLKPHNKYLYAFRKYPDIAIVTVDDDIFYDTKMLERLFSSSYTYPNCIICNRGLLISQDEEYSSWHSLREEYGPSSRICPTGVGGVLYPPHSYNNELFNESVIIKTCLNADDLWLSFMSRLNGKKIVKAKGFIEPIAINSSQKEALCKTNNGIENRNDVQIRQISNYALETYDVDFFVGV